jgi:integrase/recombinase XerD
MTDPAWLLHCQRILAMPNKRYVKRAVTFLDAEEIAALLAAPDRSTWAGRRDHALLLLAIQTGLRASELVNLRCGDVALGSGAHIRCMGKGRKERCTPLRRDTAKLLAAWIGNRSDNNRPLFPSIRGERLSRDALEHLVRKHCLTTSRACPSLTVKRVTPHTLRHSTAMDLLHHGVDQAVIALWLGHESVATSQIYIHADMRMKEKALARVAAPATPTSRFQPDDQLLAFLEGSDYAEPPHGQKLGKQAPAEAMRHNPGYGIMRYGMEERLVDIKHALTDEKEEIQRYVFGVSKTELRNEVHAATSSTGRSVGLGPGGRRLRRLQG